MSTRVLSPEVVKPDPSSEELSSGHIEELALLDATDFDVMDDDADAVATQRRERIAPTDDVFQKVR